MWSRHRRHMFWIAFSAFLLVHVVGILAFTVWVRPLFVAEWMVLGVIESFFVVAFVEWITWRFTRHDGGL
jgi:hypothetical protein